MSILSVYRKFLGYTGRLNGIFDILQTKRFLSPLSGALFNWWVSFAPEFQCCYFCESSCLFYLNFNFDVYVSKTMQLLVRNFKVKLAPCNFY